MANPYDIALDMVSQGYSVIKLEPLGKKPIDRKWNISAVSTALDVNRLWQKGVGRFNVGIVMTPGLFVLDIDGVDGVRQLRKIERKFGKLPRTRKIKTSSGDGWHHYYKYDPERWRVTNSRGLLIDELRGEGDAGEAIKIDIRGIGGQVVAPGCRVQYGDAETGHIGISKVVVKGPVVDAPEWLLELITHKPKPQDDFEIEPISDLEMSQVASALTKVDIKTYDEWLKVGMAIHTTGHPDAFALFNAWSSKQPNYEGEDDCAAHWRSFRTKNSDGAMVRYPTIFYLARQRGWEPPPPKIDLSGLAAPGETEDLEIEAAEALASPTGFSDDALAMRAANALRGRCRYIPQWKRWMVWDGKCWRQDTALVTQDAVREILRAEAQRCDDIATAIRKKPDAAKDGLRLADGMAKISTRLRSTKTQENVTRQLVAERRENAPVVATPEIWDQDHEIINTPAGPYSLRTGELIEQSMNRYCSMVTSVAPSFLPPDRFTDFLKEVFDGSDEVIRFVQGYVGYAATGYTREECLLFAHGAGGNGKGVLFNTIYKALGSYAKVVDPDMFTLAGSNAHKSSLAALVGKRFVLSQEIPESTHWNEARLKSLSSGDVIEANFMRSEKFEFKPRCSIVICSNPKPAFRAVGDAIKRRFRFVSFNQSFVGREDPTLSQALEAEADRILGWIIEGSKRYLAEGLTVPREIELATSTYLDEADTLGQWLLDVVETEDNRVGTETHWHPLRAIFANYVSYCRTMHARPVGRSTVVDSLSRNGVIERNLTVLRYSDKRGRYYGPIRLLSN